MSLPKYPKYKDSGVEWLGEVPNEWNVMPLVRAASVNDDVLPDSTPPDFTIEYVDIGSVSLDKGIERTEQFCFADAPSRARRLVHDGDVLVSTVRTYLKAIAPVIRPPENLVVSTGFAVIRPNKILTPGYAKYVLQATGFVNEVISRSTGVSYPAINASDLVRIPLPIPNSSEQTAIATFLDRETAKIGALIAEQENLLTLLAEKRQATISHAVTKGLDPDVPMKDSGVEWLGEVPEHWIVTKAKFISTRIASGKTPLGGSEVYVAEGITFLRSQNVHDEGLRLDDVVFITTEVEQKMASSRVLPGDILLNITGASIGRSCVVPEGFNPANVNQHVCVIRLLDCENVNYVGWFFRSYQVKAQIDNVQSGAAREGLNFQQIGDMNIPMPPAAEQRHIADFLNDATAKLDTLADEARKGIDLLKERRSALISAAVTGKIDVRAA